MKLASDTNINEREHEAASLVFTYCREICGLALDYSLRPVLQSLGAKHILPGIYATDSQVTLTPEGAYDIHADIAARLDDAVNVLVTETLRPSPAQATRFAPVNFADVRCSV